MLVTEGDEIKEDQAVLLVETEKAQVELPSPFGGRVAAVHVQAGQRVKVGAVLLSFGDAGSAARPARRPPRRPRRRRPVPGAPAPARRPQPAFRPPRSRARRPGARGRRFRPPPPRRRAGSRASWAWTSPSVRGTGPGGRISDEDVRAAAGARGQASTPATPGTAAPASGALKSPAPAGPAEAARPLAGHVALPPLPRFEQWGPVEREPLRGIRRRSAEHLSLAWAVIPHVTQHDQADVTELETMRRRHQKRGGEGHADLTLTVFLVKAVATVLRSHPRFNASLDQATGELVLKRYYNIGVAVDTDQGLVVPVVRGVDSKGIRELAAELSQLAARTREGKATLEDLRGGTFTVTNTGALGGTGATPIINYPEVAILGVGRARPHAGRPGRPDRPAPGPAAVARLRPPGDRRHGGGALLHRARRPPRGSRAPLPRRVGGPAPVVMGELPREADLVVLGGGPGGYAAAFRAADLGLDTVLVEAREALGGECLHVGCIPSKALLGIAALIHDAAGAAAAGVAFGPPGVDAAEAARLDPCGPSDRLAQGLAALAKTRGVDVVQGHGRFEADGSIRVAREDAPPATLRFKHAIVATGSRPATLPGLEPGPARVGLDRGARPSADAGAPPGGGRRVHRARARQRVRGARDRGDGGGAPGRRSCRGSIGTW